MNFGIILFILLLAWPYFLKGEESAENMALKFSHRSLGEKTSANLPKGREQEVIDALIRQPDRPTLLLINHVPTV